MAQVSPRFPAACFLLLWIACFCGCQRRDDSTSRSTTAENRSAPFAPSTVVPSSSEGAQIHMGREIFNHTPQFASRYVGAKISCGDCHLAAGTMAYAAPMVDLAGMFPMYNKRAGHVISLEDRIQECFTRSENGHPLPYNSPEMKAIVAYIDWLSRDEIKGKPWKGRGFITLPVLQGNADHGAVQYRVQCASCHGEDGHGVPPVLPPLWGDDSFNDGAGMNDPAKMAAFLRNNMPQNHPGSLTAQDAYDIAAYVHTMPRPKFDKVYASF